MIQTIQKIDFQSITKLPLRELLKSNNGGSAILVKTPHKGEIAIDTQIVGGFFTRKVSEKTVSEIAIQIQDLEKEAKNFLLEKWLEDLTT